MVVVLLFICTCAYVHAQLPSLINKDKAGYVASRSLQNGRQHGQLIRVCVRARIQSCWGARQSGLDRRVPESLRRRRVLDHGHQPTVPMSQPIQLSSDA